MAWVGKNGKAYFGAFVPEHNQGTELYREFGTNQEALDYVDSLNGGLPPLGVHVEEEIDVTTILGGGGYNPD